MDKLSQLVPQVSATKVTPLRRARYHYGCKDH